MSNKMHFTKVRLRQTLIRCTLAALATGSLFVSDYAFSAQINLITNGSFEQTTATNSTLFTNSNVNGWSIAHNPEGDYTFLTFEGQADTNVGDGGFGSFGLWNPGGNSIPNSSPDGGNFVVSDGAFRNGTIYTTVNGLEVGKRYELSFYQAAGQQDGFDGDTKERWQVTLGGSIAYGTIDLLDGSTMSNIGILTGGVTQYSDLMINPSHGFQPWQKQTMTFTATNNSELLGFLALGSPLGQPPFVLLDGVSLTEQLPEPDSIWLWALGALAISVTKRRKLDKI